MFPASAWPTLRRAVVLGSCLALSLTAVPVEAAKPSRPPRLGAVKGLEVSVTSPAYRVVSDWDDLSGASAYRVTLTTPDYKVVRETQASEFTFVRSDLVYNTSVRVAVVPMREVRPRLGRVASATTRVPDLIAPTGSFEMTLPPDQRTASVRELSVSDNAGAAGITRTVDWGDGSAAERYSAAVETSHEYPVGPRAYHPTVTLSDASGNQSVVPLGAAVIDDTEAPSGEFTVLAPGTTWAAFTRIALRQVGVSDDASAPENIARVVDWGDGTTSTWDGARALGHRYALKGRYVPAITLTDESGKSTRVPTSEVTVRRDATAPVTTLVRPLRPKSVRAWRTLRGRITDAGTGARQVKVSVVEKRAGAWHGYRPATRTWVRRSTRAQAVRASRIGAVRPVGDRWSMPVKGLRKGLLVVTVQGVDAVRNVSAPRTAKQRLSRR